MYDAIVIGVGGVGSAALYHLAKRGASVLGLDRFEPGHDRGSSHGRTRIIRQAYFEHPDYVPLLLRAYDLWNELGERRGRTLLHEIGLLQIGPPDGPVVQGVLASALRHGLDVERLSAAQIAQRFPAFAGAEDGAEDTTGVFEPRAGYLDVEQCVVAHADEARKLGALIETGDGVHGYRREPGQIVVDTSGGQLTAARLVITAGPWAGDFLADLKIPLVVRRKPTYWYRIDEPRFQADQGCPAFLFETADGVFYGLPAVDEFGLKAAEHSGGATVIDPLAVDRSLDIADRDRVERFLAKHLPGAEQRRGEHAVCMYTLTPDEHFIVDCHPDDPRIVFAAGLSGHGFKFSGVLGEALADLALDGRTDLPIGFLALSRPALRSDPAGR